MKAKVGKKYTHYKNKKTYLVLHTGQHTETGEKMVVYEGQYNDPEYGQNPVWIRPIKMFEEQVLHNDILVDRFTIST